MTRKLQDKGTAEMPAYSSRHFFKACLRLLGEDGFYKIFRVGPREAYRWAANPDHCADVRRNLVDQLESAVGELDIMGQEELALAPARILAAKVNHRVVPCKYHPDGENMHHEMFQGSQAVSAFYRAIDDGGDYMETRPMLDAAIKELEDVWARRREEDTRGGCASEFKEQAS